MEQVKGLFFFSLKEDFNVKKIEKIKKNFSNDTVSQPIFAVSSSGTGKWVPGQYDSGMRTTDNKTSVGMLIRRLVISWWLLCLY